MGSAKTEEWGGEVPGAGDGLEETYGDLGLARLRIASGGEVPGGLFPVHVSARGAQAMAAVESGTWRMSAEDRQRWLDGHPEQLWPFQVDRPRADTPERAFGALIGTLGAGGAMGKAFQEDPEARAAVYAVMQALYEAGKREGAHEAYVDMGQLR